MKGWLAFLAGSVFAVAFLVTCGGVPGAEGATVGEVYRSGTRIKLRSLSGSDGSRTFGGLYDSKEGTDCVVVRFEDDKLRCLPSPAAAIDNLYSDAGCLTPIAGQPVAVLGRPSFAAANSHGVYSNVVRLTAPYDGDVFRRGSEFATDPTKCWKQNRVNLDQVFSGYFVIGAGVTGDELVEFTEGVEN